MLPRVHFGLERDTENKRVSLPPEKNSLVLLRGQQQRLLILWPCSVEYLLSTRTEGQMYSVIPHVANSGCFLSVEVCLWYGSGCGSG